MTAPIRCFSSQMTSRLMEFRNPEGREEHWLNREEKIDHPLLYMGRVVVTEIGASLLCVTATIETLAYGILFLGSLPISLMGMKPLFGLKPLMASSSFTVYWNFGNVVAFNLFCIHVAVDESMARFSLDHWPRGQHLLTALRLMEFVLKTVLIVCTGGQHLPRNVFASWLPNVTMRPEDEAYLLSLSHFQNHLAYSGESRFLSSAAAHGEGAVTTHQAPLVARGRKFFKDYIYDRVTASTRSAIDMFDCEIFHFAATRTVYLCLFDSSCKEKSPQFDFLKDETRVEIAKLQDLREPTPFQRALFKEIMEEYTEASFSGDLWQQSVEILEALVANDLATANQCFSCLDEQRQIEICSLWKTSVHDLQEGDQAAELREVLGQRLPPLRLLQKALSSLKEAQVLLRSLKSAASYELQGSLFLTKCFGNCSSS